MAEEALACFNSLLDNVPVWIADLEGILRAAAQRQEEILFANQPQESTRVSSEVRTKSKSSSLRSRLSNGNLRGPKHLTNSDALRLSQRKRKTDSVCSGDHSGPVKYRTKAAAVVYYDGETQKQFEKLVRAVGSSRNSIRKGKMSAKVESLARAGSSSSEGSSSSGSEDVDADADFRCLAARLEFKTTRSRPSAASRGDNTEVFDKVDGRLEKAQALCERAAHQILRDGDCTQEVSNAKDQLQEAIQLANAEVPSLQKKADKAAERRRRSDERRRAQEEAEERRKSASQVSVKILDIGPLASENKLEVDELEVGDESDDDDQFNLPALRGGFGKLGEFRSTRATRLVNPC